MQGIASGRIYPVLFRRKRSNSPSPASEAHFPTDNRYKETVKTFDALLDEVLWACNGKAQTHMAEIVTFDPTRQILVSLGIRPDDSVALPTRLRGSSKQVVQVVAQHGEPVRIDDFQQETQRQPHLHSTVSALVLPVRQGRQVVGVINVESTVPNAFVGIWPDRAHTLQPLLDRAAYLLSEPRAHAFATMAATPDGMLERVRDQIYAIIDPVNFAGIYDQILHVAVQMTDQPQSVGAVHLLRKRIWPLDRAGAMDGVGCTTSRLCPR